MLRNAVILSVFLYTLLPANAQEKGHHGGVTPASAVCLTTEQSLAIHNQIDRHRQAKGIISHLPTTFLDPMPGGTNSFGQSVVNYVDLDPSSGLKDYSCRQVTYDGHQGTDIEILDFFLMDEGRPVLAAAAGTVMYQRDGENDRNTEWVSGRAANTVVISHDDGSLAYYLHFRKNSIRVRSGDSVMVGDTLGYIGSSGFSSGPHLHFEINQNGETIDPFNGTCQETPSRWVDQGAHVLDLPFELMHNGLTTLPLDWPLILERPPGKTHITSGSRIYSWIRARNLMDSDVLNWRFYVNGTYWDSYTFSPGITYASSWWYVYWNLPNNSSLFGDWEIRINRNGSHIATQSFTYDGAANQPAIMEPVTYDINEDGRFEGEFSANDPDGSVFWFSITKAAEHGTINQFGGRKRKFSYTPDPGFSGPDTIWVAATDDENLTGPAGFVAFNVGTPVSVDNNTDLLPTGITLQQNYPNPFNPVTTIGYELMNAGHMKLAIYDIRGREVKILEDQFKEAGVYRLEFSAGELSGGIYLYRLETREFFETRKFVVIK